MPHPTTSAAIVLRFSRGSFDARQPSCDLATVADDVWMMGEGIEPVSCLVCRKRKIKCDRATGNCRNCRKFGVQCQYSAASGADVAHDPVTTDDSVTQAGFKRRRILRSCIECKRAKAKCSGGDVCERCGKKSLECFYHDLESPGPQQNGLTSGLLDDSMPKWLTSTKLPPVEGIRKLIDIYFTRIHTVRCLGFLHIPTFMERLKEPAVLYADTSGLIHIVCALAAPFYYANSADSEFEEGNASHRYYEAGKGWAAGAVQHVFSDLDNPGIEPLMTQVLLHEYFLRCGNFAKAFLISGLIARNLQVLQLNSEQDSAIGCQRSKISWSVEESRRRVIWSCYLLDASIESGTEQFRFVSPDAIQVQLPCSEDLFVRNKHCITEMLLPGKHQLLDNPQNGVSAADNLDIRAFYIRAVAVRSKVLKYVKGLEGEIPWRLSPESQFTRLDRELRNLEDSLPDNFQLTPENTYIFKSSGRLSLYFALNILISQMFIDLYRVGVSQLVQPITATWWIRKNAPADFIKRCHRMCARKAIHIGSLLEELWNLDRVSVVDIPFAAHAQLCSSVLVTTLVSWTAPDDLDPDIPVERSRQILHGNIIVLDYLRKYIKADLYHESAVQALEQFDELFPDQPEVPDKPTSKTTSPDGTTRRPSQFSLEYILSPPRIYPVVMKQAQDQPEFQARGTEPTAPVGSGDSGLPGSGTTDAVNRKSSTPKDTPFSLMWDWGTEAPSVDHMGYPTFLKKPQRSSDAFSRQ